VHEPPSSRFILVLQVWTEIESSAPDLFKVARLRKSGQLKECGQCSTGCGWELGSGPILMTCQYTETQSLSLLLVSVLSPPPFAYNCTALVGALNPSFLPRLCYPKRLQTRVPYRVLSRCVALAGIAPWLLPSLIVHCCNCAFPMFLSF